MSELVIYGCKVIPLMDEACHLVLGWLDGNAKPEDLSDGLDWSLAYIDDGLIWAKCNSGKWTRADTVFPSHTGSWTMERLQEIRLFGPKAEVHICRPASGFQGWLINDTSLAGLDDYLLPMEEQRLLRCRYFRQASNGFTLLASERGHLQAVPLELAPRKNNGDEVGNIYLGLKNYFCQDENGAVRVGLSRFMNLEGRN